MTGQPIKLLAHLQPYLQDGTALWISAPIALCIDERRLLACHDPAAEVAAAIKFLQAFLRTTQASAQAPTTNPTINPTTNPTTPTPV